MDTHPVIIVGGGLAGLTAAHLLAERGLAVVCLERSGRTGGRASSSDHRGHLLNLGPHALAEAGPGTRILEEAGIPLPGHHPDMAGAHLLDNGRLVSPRDEPGAGLLEVAMGLLGGLDEPPATSVADWLSGHGLDPARNGWAGALARLTTYADGLHVQAAEVMSEAVRGGQVRYLDGGWGGLVERLRAAARAAGAQIRTGAPVRHVEPAPDGGYHVLLADGQRLAAAAVILAAGGPAEMATLVDGSPRRALREQAERATPLRMACLDVALSRRPSALPSLVLGADEPLYLSVHSDAARLAPDGGAVVHVARFLSPGESAPPGTRRQLEGLLDRLVPSWGDEVVHARYLPGLTVTHDAGLLATGGLAGRADVRAPQVPGLLVAGDWVGPHGTLAQASLASAAHAAREAAAAGGHGRLWDGTVPAPARSSSRTRAGRRVSFPA